MLKRIEKESADRFTCLVIGGAGIGKTSLLRTIPAGEKTCVLSAEAGLLCVRDLVRSGQVEGFEIADFNNMREAYRMFQDGVDYRWVFIDSLTEISARCVETMKEKHINNKDAFKMWGEYNDLMTMIIKGFRDLTQYNVVFTALPTVEKDESNRRYISPAISGSALKERLTSYFDEVFYMTTKEMENNVEYRCFITQPITQYPAKDRSGKLSLIEKPDLTYIKEKILNGGNNNE